jgi:sodium-dependent dicarboxylate transporter 2/3/5
VTGAPGGAIGADERALRRRGAARAAALLAGPAAFGLALAVPSVGLDLRTRIVAGVFAWAVAYWVTEAIPVAATALLASALTIVLGLAPARTVLAPYADPVIFVFLGSFVLAEAMRVTGLDRRFALAVLGARWATASPGRLLAALGLATCLISLWLSNTATTAIMLPVGLGVLRALGPLGDPGASRFPVGLLLMLTWASSVAVGTPVASPPNLIAIAMLRELAGTRLTFFDWVAVTMPLTVAMLLLAWLVLHVRYGGGATAVADVRPAVERAREALGPWTPAQRTVAFVFGLACAGWILPGAVAAVGAADAPAARLLEDHFPEAAVAMLAAVLLLLLPVDLRRGERVLSWEQASRIDWGTILLFGGGLSLGRMLFDSGLAERVGRGVVAVTGADGVWALTAVAIGLGVGLSEVASNTASASAVLPIVVALARGAGVSPVPPALGAALGASFGFVLPVSTPPNAIVYGSGLVPLREMARAGLWLDVTGACLIWLGLRLLCPPLGLA